jgi:DNA-binding transcriptional ArsR family regulator
VVRRGPLPVRVSDGDLPLTRKVCRLRLITHERPRTRKTPTVEFPQRRGLTTSLSKDIFRNMAFEGPRQLTDPKAMRAMAHPVRLALLQALNDAGTLTATEAAERVGESPSNCSFHLRQLAKYGFVEEAPGGTGRQRPWRAIHTGFSMTDVHEDPETAMAAGALASVVTDRWLERARQGLDRRRYAPDEWRRVTGTDQMTLYVTPDEMKAINDELLAILGRYRERIADAAKRPEGSRPVEHISFYYVADR